MIGMRLANGLLAEPNIVRKAFDEIAAGAAWFGATPPV
ncbi:hypothetical protein ABH973_003642 [Bradyrhizobium ottawaense]